MSLETERLTFAQVSPAASDRARTENEGFLIVRALFTIPPSKDLHGVPELGVLFYQEGEACRTEIPRGEKSEHWLAQVSKL